MLTRNEVIAFKSYWKFRRQKLRELRAQQRLDDGIILRNKRHINFVALFFPKVLYLMSKTGPKPKSKRKEAQAELIAAAITCLPEAGFRTPIYTKDGSVNSKAINAVNSMLKMPAIQDALLARFEDIGFSPKDADNKLVELINSSDEKIASNNLQFYYKLTTPTQVIKTENKNLNLNQQLNSPTDSWNSEPPIFLDEN